MNHSTYSFLDLSGAIAHKKYAAFTFSGKGVGSVTISMSTEKTAHDVAADGSVMVSKVAGNNGTITIQCQQTSEVHKWLLAWYTWLMAADTKHWANTGATLRNSSDGTSHLITGISPQKVPDKAYQAQGQMVSWVLMAAEIHSLSPEKGA
jgi:hypothetical protein